jgi:hypothetical protein
VLVPAHLLVNGATVAREPASGLIIYHHIELARHAVVLAEGLPSETYLDTGNRGAFLASAGAARRRRVHAESCSPLVTGGAVLTAIRARLHRRAVALGYRVSATPGLQLRAGGQAIRPRRLGEGVYEFDLPPGAHAARLLSRGGIPATIDPGSNDRRYLGLAVRRVRLLRGSWGIDVDLRNGLLQGGFYPREGAGAHHWRWTDGNALLRLPVGLGIDRLRIEVERTTGRWLAPGEGRMNEEAR